MYEENTNKGSFIKDLVIKLLYMLLFLFLFMWLYPAPKVDLSNVKVNVDETALKPLLNGVFADNIEAMRVAAKDYYTIERLPKNKGDNSMLSLQDMLNKKMVVPFVGEDGKACDAKNSYVKVIKNDDDYTLKVYLECGDKKDYITDTIGCTSTCVGCNTTPETIATKVVSAINTGKVSTTTASTASVKKTTSTQTTVAKTTQTNTPTTNYEYVKDVTTWSLDNTWVKDSKSGSNVRLYDTRTTTETESEPDSYTYRTVSWVNSSENGNYYTLHLNNIPENATNVRITSKSKFAYNYGGYNYYGNHITNINTNELSQYFDKRWTCVINMDGYGCPTPSDPATLPSSYNYNMPDSWSFSINGPQKSYGYRGFTNYGYNSYGSYGYGSYQPNGSWVVFVSANRYSNFDNNEYMLPIKFTVKWDAETETKVKEYKYEYSTTKTEYKYSTNPNDLNLINEGYRRK